MSSDPWQSGFIPWDYGEAQPVLYLKPPRQVQYADASDYFEQHIEALRAAWLVDCFPRVQLLEEAKTLCREHNRPVPEWLDQALSERLQASVSDGPKARGRQAKESGSERDRHKHYVRWSYARTALARRKDLPLFGYAATKDGAWEFVSDQLRGTAAQGEPPTIERSYHLIRRRVARRNSK